MSAYAQETQSCKYEHVKIYKLQLAIKCRVLKSQLQLTHLVRNVII